MVTSGTSIARLRITSSGLDPRTAQTRLARQLRVARLAPGGLGERALLCVRRVRDPRPGRVRLSSPSSWVPLDWEQAVRDHLDALSQRAERPALRHVPSSAEAVLFADPAELLASLASDLCAGLAHERWWWRNLYGGADLRRALLDALRESPEPLPMLVEFLAQRGQAISFVASLTQVEVEVLLEGLLISFGLVRLREALRSAAEMPFAPAPAPSYLAALSPPTRVPRADADGLREPPWIEIVSDAAAPALPPAHQVLLAVAVLLRRAPMTLRSATFVQAVARWSAAATTAELAAPPSAAARREASPAQPAPLPAVEALLLAPAVISQNATSAPPPIRAASDEASPAAARYEPLTRVVAASPTAHVGLAASPDAAVPSIQARNLETTLEQRADAAVVHTDLGGLFYLINVALALDLYGDFTQPLRPGIDLPIWDFLTLVGRRLLRRRLPKDPLWELLRNLAGRGPRERPGASFVPPIDDWLRETMPPIRQYLRQARVGRELIPHRARVEVTPIYLDVYLSLDELPISIRLAGLDRDPGWIPAAARYVHFHFD